MSIRQLSTTVLSTESIAWIFLLLLTIFNLLPVIWMVSVSFKSLPDLYHRPIRLLPRSPILKNYSEVLKDPRMIKYFVNSILITVSSTGICIVLGIFAGYGFARYNFPGKKLLLSYVLFSTVLPRVIVLIPLYLLLVKLKLQGSYQGIIFCYLSVILPLAVWLFSLFIDTIPKDLEDAARIDGCNTILLIWKILLPILAPSIFAILLYSFVLSWNEYLLPLVICTNKTMPITVGLAHYQEEVFINWGNIMATSCLMTVPTMVLFLFYAKYLVSGLSAGAVKG